MSNPSPQKYTYTGQIAANAVLFGFGHLVETEVALERLLRDRGADESTIVAVRANSGSTNDGGKVHSVVVYLWRRGPVLRSSSKATHGRVCESTEKARCTRDNMLTRWTKSDLENNRTECRGVVLK